MPSCWRVSESVVRCPVDDSVVVQAEADFVDQAGTEGVGPVDDAGFHGDTAEGWEGEEVAVVADAVLCALGEADGEVVAIGGAVVELDVALVGIDVAVGGVDEVVKDSADVLLREARRVSEKSFLTAGSYILTGIWLRTKGLRAPVAVAV